MSNVPLGNLTVETAPEPDWSFVVSRPNPAQPEKQTFDRLSVAVLSTALSGGTISAIEIPALHKTIPASEIKDTALSLPLYQVIDQNDLSNLLLLSIEISYEDYIGSRFTYELWEGNPSEPNSKLLATAGRDIFFTRLTPKFASSATAYLDNSSLRVGLWIKVINRLTSPLKFSAKLAFLKLPPVGSPVTIPTYTPPAVTIDPNQPQLSVVHVGPGQQFEEMADAMPYLAPGFEMIVHSGNYFKPFYIPQGMDGYYIHAAPGANAETIICNGRGGWVTGYPTWLTNDAPGDGPVNPFRLSRGKAFILVNSPGIIEGLGGMYCGGGYGANLPDNIGDGEAFIYAENFAALSQVVVRRCAMNGNENGVFVPSVSGPGANVRMWIDYCSFSDRVANGQTPDGLSHNFYCSGAETKVTNSTLYGCNGNSAKSRSPIYTTLDTYYEAGNGRCLDYPEGGTLTATRVIFSQKPGANVNYFGMAQENTNNGDGHATFIDSIMKMWRLDTTFFYLGSTTRADFAPSGQIASRVEWYPDAGFPGQALGWNYQGNQSGNVGLPRTPADGGTVMSGLPVRPAPAHLS